MFRTMVFRVLVMVTILGMMRPVAAQGRYDLSGETRNGA